MALPEQIRKQTEAVQELYKQLDMDNNTGEDNNLANGTVEAIEQADETVTQNDANPSLAEEQKTNDERVSEDTIVQKYKTLQGMYNAEVPRLHQQNRDMQSRVQQMEQLLASISAQQDNKPQQTIEKLVSDKDVEEYGESLDVMRKVSREEIVPMTQRLAHIESLIQQMQTNVIPQVQAVAQRQAMSSEQAFWSELTAEQSNWREINDNQAFQTWLLDTDPLTGITRQTYLDDAQRSLDARRVASFFRTWLDTTGQANVAQTNKSTYQSELEKQVAPGRSKNSGAPTSNKSKVYTPDDIRSFFDDVRSGKFKGREPERDRIERDIFAAQRENRITINA
jgi:hypothetical protein